jgi:SNF2 family DNA or RNA helicase
MKINKYAGESIFMERMQFEKSLSEKGTMVRSRHDTGLIGTCTGRIRDNGDGLMVHVQFPGQNPQFELAEDLEPVDIELDDREQILQGRFARAEHLRKRLTSVQLAGQLAEMIYSLDTTDTKFMPHQFKPLLALLDSPSKGILIADEVGLGKTIEAGLIWTELRFRTSATRMLVICPAVLMEKWKMELSRRFGTASQFMNAKELLIHLEQGDAASKVPAIICSLQGLRPPTDSIDEGSKSNSASAKLARFLDSAQDQTLFDLVVIDEAHYLRNHETSSAMLGQLLRPVSDYFVLLSATPVNNHSRDLFNLVSLVDPDQFRFESEFDGILSANRPLVRLANQLKKPDVTYEIVKETLAEASRHWMFKNSKSLKLLLDELDDSNLGLLSPEDRVSINRRLERINLLGQIIVRSRKREVLENRVERNVTNRPVKMTTAEAEFYQRVTDAVISYSINHEGVQGFLLATPQRLMSSSMYAAANRWLNKKQIFSESESLEFAYEAFGEDVESDDDISVTEYVTKAINGHIDIDQLRKKDSKYNELESLLKEFIKDSPGEKAIVFSYFRDTLDYLQERLSEAGIAALVVKGGDDKHLKINEFKESNKYKILLASEVAAEGVDLQFMRFLINYDLPWNPMRIEQRIGRIDRIGQESQVIAIANLVYKDTIDDRILIRLFDKLKLFEDALGCTEDVIQNGITLLTRDLLSRFMTPEQQKLRIDQAVIAMENNRRDMDEIQEHEADFVGLGSFLRDKVTHARNSQRRITDDDLRQHIKEYLQDNSPGYVMSMDPGGATGIMRLSPDTTAALSRFREARQLPRTKLESGGEVSVVIRNHVNRGDFPSKYELINQYHPLVRMIADSDSKNHQNEIVVATELQPGIFDKELPAGDYAFSAEIWKFEGARKEETILACFDSLLDDTIVHGEIAFDLLNILRSQAKDWLDVNRQITNKSMAVEKLEYAKSTLLKIYKEARSEYEAENSDRISMQRESLARSLTRRVSSLQESIYKTSDANRATYRKMTEGKIRKIQEINTVAVANLDHRAKPQFKRKSIISGVVRVRS